MSRLICYSILLAVLLVATCQSAPAVDSAEKKSCDEQPLEQQSSNKQPSENENQARELKLTNQQLDSAEAAGETEKRSYYGRPSYSNSYQPIYAPPEVYYQNYPVVKHRPYYQNKPIIIPVPQPELKPVPVIVPVYKPCKYPASTAAPALVHYYKDNKDKVNKLLLTAMNYGDKGHQQLMEMASKDTLAKNKNQAHFLEQV